MFSAATWHILFDGMSDWWGLTATIAGVYLLAGGSSALNQFQERDRDGLMPRTAGRPIPAKQIKETSALLIALSMMAAGILTLFLFTGIVPVILGFINVILYNLIYTPLKRHSSLALLPGALVGAIPPLIGFTAAGGNILAPEALFISLFMFIWQLPHFWLLQIAYNDDYQKAGFDSFIRFPGEKSKKIAILSSIVLVSALVVSGRQFGIFYEKGIYIFLALINVALLLTSAILLQAISAGRNAGKQAAQLLKTLNIYSFIILALIIIVSAG
jgi:protoheme IX farnesyltransferase